MPGPLIPPELVKTRLDERVNRAYELAQKKQRRQYVWSPGEGDHDPILITDWRPQDDPCVAVDPAGYAIVLVVGAEEITLGG